MPPTTPYIVAAELPWCHQRNLTFRMYFDGWYTTMPGCFAKSVKSLPMPTPFPACHCRLRPAQSQQAYMGDTANCLLRDELTWSQINCFNRGRCWAKDAESTFVPSCL